MLPDVYQPLMWTGSCRHVADKHVITPYVRVNACRPTEQQEPTQQPTSSSSSSSSHHGSSSSDDDGGQDGRPTLPDSSSCPSMVMAEITELGVQAESAHVRHDAATMTMPQISTSAGQALPELQTSAPPSTAGAVSAEVSAHSSLGGQPQCSGDLPSDGLVKQVLHELQEGRERCASPHCLWPFWAHC